MNLTLKIAGSADVIISIDPTLTVKDFKDQIASTTSIPVAAQRVLYFGIELEDSLVMGVGPCDGHSVKVIDLREKTLQQPSTGYLPNHYKIALTIKVAGRADVIIPCDRTLTVKAFKNGIAQMTSIPVSSMRVLYKGSEINENGVLAGENCTPWGGLCDGHSVEVLDLGGKVPASEEDKEIADLAAKRRDLEARVAQRRAQKAREALKDAERRELSSAETASLRALFARFDTDGSGYIDLPELRQCVTELGCAMTDDELATAMAAIDVDSDGKISFIEFVAWWSGDKKLGGNSGVMLAVMRAKMVASLALSDLESRRVNLPIDYLSSDVNETSFAVRTSAAFEPKASVNFSLLPMTHSVFDIAMEEWTKGYTFAREKNEDGEKIKAALALELAVRDDASDEAIAAGIETVISFLDSTIGTGREMKDLKFKLYAEGRVIKVFLYVYAKGSPFEEFIRPIARALKQEVADFNANVFFEHVAFSFETGFDFCKAAENMDDMSTRLLDLFDNFALQQSMSLRKDAVDYLIVEILHKGPAAFFRPGPEVAQLFGGFMSSSVKGSVVVQSAPATLKNVARHLSERFRFRLQKAKETGIPTDPDLVEAMKIFEEEGALEMFFEGMIERNGNKPIPVMKAFVEKDLLRSLETPGLAAVFKVAELIKEITTYKVMAPFAAATATFTGYNPVWFIPSTDAKVAAAKARVADDLRDKKTEETDFFQKNKESMKVLSELLFDGYKPCVEKLSS